MENITKSEVGILIADKEIHLIGNLSIPEGAESIVIFSHGSGSSRFSPRNNYVAQVLNERKIATLLIDLLSAQEDSVYENRFNIKLLTNRLVAVTEDVHRNASLRNFHIGYFGASTGAASAIDASVRLNDIVGAIVSRGGRPDLSLGKLPFVTAPTLLIVGGLDVDVIKLNKDAYRQLNCEKKLQIVNGATHLFEEAGKLAEVAELAADWFERNLGIVNLQEHKVRSLHYDI